MENRSEDLKRLANHFGLEYMPGGQHVLGDSFEHMWPFCHGLPNHATDLLYGTYAGHEWTLFDYVFQLDDDDRSFGVICAEVPCALPTLHLSPETFLERVGCKLGIHEMTFEVEEFNRRYFIRANDERSAYDILHPQSIDYLLSLPVRDWQIHGCQIVVARNSEYSIDEIPQVMQEIDGFIRLIPGYVLEDQGFTPDWKGPFK